MKSIKIQFSHDGAENTGGNQQADTQAETGTAADQQDAGADPEPGDEDSDADEDDSDA